jgi:hypothetical protein
MTTAILLCSLLLAGAALASSEQSYALTWWTVDGGGGTSGTGGGYSLGGSVGQPDAGVLEGGVYVLAGGLWPGRGPVFEQHVYLPLILK